MDPVSEAKPWNGREPWIVAISLLFMGCLMWTSARSMSPTYDEPLHIVSGMAYWQMQDTRLFPEHPPLAKIIAAAPVVLFAPSPDYKSDLYCGRVPCEWLFPARYFTDTKQPERITMLARFPMILITLLLGWSIYRSARRVGIQGRPSGRPGG